MSKIHSGLGFAVASAAALFAFQVSAAEVTLKAVTGLLPTNPMTKSFLANFLKPVNERGKGVAQVKYLGAHNIVHPTKAAAALKRGVFDILHSPTSYYIGMVPEGFALLASNQHPRVLRKNGGWAILQEAYAKKAGSHLLAWGESNTAYNTYLVVMPKFDKDGVPDLSGIKMRATGTYRPLFNALGASTINMKSSEIYTGLQRGTVQGFGWPFVGVPSLGLHKLVKYRVTPPYYQSNVVTTVNTAKWNSLSKKQKDFLNKISLEYEETSLAFINKERAIDDKTLRDAGVKDIALKGNAAKSYLATAHGEIWKTLAKRSEYSARLREKLYLTK